MEGKGENPLRLDAGQVAALRSLSQAQDFGTLPISADSLVYAALSDDHKLYLQTALRILPDRPAGSGLQYSIKFYASIRVLPRVSLHEFLIVLCSFCFMVLEILELPSRESLPVSAFFTAVYTLDFMLESALTLGSGSSS